MSEGYSPRNLSYLIPLCLAAFLPFCILICSCIKLVVLSARIEACRLCFCKRCESEDGCFTCLKCSRKPLSESAVLTLGKTSAKTEAGILGLGNGPKRDRSDGGSTSNSEVGAVNRGEEAAGSARTNGTRESPRRIPITFEESEEEESPRIELESGQRHRLDQELGRWRAATESIDVRHPTQWPRTRRAAATEGERGA